MANPLSKVASGIRGAETGPADQNTGVAFLMASVTAVAALFTTLGVTGGLLGRMVRNHPELASVAAVAAVIATVLGVVGWMLKSKPVPQARVLSVGLLLFLVAAVAAIWAAVNTWGDEFAPRVTAVVEKGTRGELIALEVDAAGLEADERIQTSIWPVTEQRGPAFSQQGQALNSQFKYKTGGLPLYQLINGPDADGNIDLSVKVPVPARHPPVVVVHSAIGEHTPDDCFEDESDSGCAILELGQAGRPQIDLDWEVASGGPDLLAIKVSASKVPEETVEVAVVGREEKRRPVLARARLAAGPDGELARSLEVPVADQIRAVCVAAATVEDVTCPPAVEPSEEQLELCIATIQPAGKDRRQRCLDAIGANLNRSATWLRLPSPR